MSLELVFDDTSVLPKDLQALVGVDHYGSLVFRRKSRLEAMQDVAEQAGAGFLSMRTEADRAALAARLKEEDDDQLYLFCPSHLISVGDADSLVTFLRQVRYAPSGLHMPLAGARDRRGWALMRTPLVRKFLQKAQEGDQDGFFEQHGQGFVEVRDRLHLIDISDERTLLDFLSGQFDARHFNSIEHDEFTVRKRSHDRAKMKREFDFYHLAPPEMQMFLVQPFDFQDDGKTASYRMERIMVPDMALQWVQGAFQPAEFERFLGRIFHFIQHRPNRQVELSDAEITRNSLYLGKVRERIEALKKMDAYAALAPLLERACGGIDALVGRYEELYRKIGSRRRSRVLTFGHGDACFSNILYSKTNQFLKLIDPRGASKDADLYTDTYYDVAKLSHSVMGGYDFINQDKFEIRVDEGLGVNLEFETQRPDWVEPMFRVWLEKVGFDPQLVRLYEASLFISMLPLHIDRPRKVLAFALNATRILDSLSQKSAAK